MKKRLGAALSGACGMGIAAVFGAAMMTASATPAAAQGATSCNGGNVSGFNRTAPAGGAANINQNGTFAAGDTLTATATGGVLSVAVDINPGANVLIFINGAAGSGSFTFPTSGTFTINGALNAAIGGGGASLGFTCTGGTGGGASATDGPSSGDVETSIDNADALEGARDVEGTRVLVGDGMDENPDSGTTLTEEERWWKEQRIKKINERLAELQERLTQISGDLESMQDAVTRAGEERDVREKPSGAEILAEIIVPGFDPRRARAESRYKSRVADIREARQGLILEQVEVQEEAADLVNEKTALEAELRAADGLPPLPSYFTATAPADRFENDFLDIVRHFDEATEAPDVQELSFNRTLTNKTVAWVRASYTRFKQGDATQQKGDTVMAAIGVHHDFWEDIRLGAFVTTKWSDVEAPLNNLDIDTRGYSLGVYGRYMIDGLALKATLRYGLSDSDISVANTTGSYDSDLVDLTLSASGRDDWSNGIWVQHSTSFSSVWTHRDGYTNSVGTRIGGNDLWSGAISLGPTIGTTLENEGIFTVIEPALGVAANYNWSNRDSQSGTVPTSDDDYFSLSLSPQLSVSTAGGTSLDLYTSVFGLAADVDGWSVGGTLSIPLN